MKEKNIFIFDYKSYHEETYFAFYFASFCNFSFHFASKTGAGSMISITTGISLSCENSIFKNAYNCCNFVVKSLRICSERRGCYIEFARYRNTSLPFGCHVQVVADSCVAHSSPASLVQLFRTIFPKLNC